MKRRNLTLCLPTVFTAVLLTACVDDSATPIDPSNPRSTDPFTDVTHTMEPTSEMEEAAKQQCLDDADLDEGYVKAVDPDTGNVRAEFSIPCDEVR